MTKFLIYSTLFLCIVLALVPHILFALSWLAGKCARFSVPYRPFGWTAVGLVALCLIVIAYGNLIGLYRTTVNEVTFTHEQVPAAFDGYRIVQISDLHVSTFARHPERLQQTIDKINALHPDLICFTGDLVSMTADELAPLRKSSALCTLKTASSPCWATTTTPPTYIPSVTSRRHKPWHA